MKSELSFLTEWLIEVALDDQIPKPFKMKIANRIKEIEKSYSAQPQTHRAAIKRPEPVVANQQSPSMQRIMANNPDLVPQVVPHIQPSAPVTADAAKALQDRQEMIRKKMNEKILIK